LHALPLALRCWYELVGQVNLSGSHPDWDFEFTDALVVDGVRAGVPLDHALDLIEVLTGDLDTLAGKLAEEIVTRIWEPLSAAGRAGELPDLLRRGRPLLLQGAAGTLADRIGAALAERAGTARDGGQLLAVLDEIRVGAVADAAGTIHRVGGDR